jgi:hypothetical protein
VVVPVVGVVELVLVVGGGDDVVVVVVVVVVVGAHEALTFLIGPMPAGTIADGAVPAGTLTLKLWVCPVTSVTVTVHSSADAGGIAATPITANTIATVAATVFNLRLRNNLTSLLRALRTRRAATRACVQANDWLRGLQRGTVEENRRYTGGTWASGRGGRDEHNRPGGVRATLHQSAHPRGHYRWEQRPWTAKTATAITPGLSDLRLSGPNPPI